MMKTSTMIQMMRPQPTANEPNHAARGHSDRPITDGQRKDTEDDEEDQARDAVVREG